MAGPEEVAQRQTRSAFGVSEDPRGVKPPRGLDRSDLRHSPPQFLLEVDLDRWPRR
jgi:hypothetical protein